MNINIITLYIGVLVLEYILVRIYFYKKGFDDGLKYNKDICKKDIEIMLKGGLKK